MSIYFPGTGAGTERTSNVPVIGTGIHMPLVTGYSARERLGPCHIPTDSASRELVQGQRRQTVASADRTL